MAGMSWEQEARAAGELLAYQKALARAPPQEGRIHVLAHEAGRRLFAALGAKSLHHVFHVAASVTDEAHIEPLEPKDYNRWVGVPEDPQGEPTAHLEMHAAVTVYGYRNGDEPRFVMLNGAFGRKRCASFAEDDSYGFHGVAGHWDAQWTIPEMANALRRIVLLDWQALGAATKRDWETSPDPKDGRIARLAFAGYVFEARGEGGPRPDHESRYQFTLGSGLNVPARPSSIVKNVPTEEWWRGVREPFLAKGESWSFKQVRRVVEKSRQIRVQIPEQFVPLERLTDPKLRRLSLMQALSYLLCESDKGPRIQPKAAARWLGVSGSQVRTHLTRARRKLNQTSDSARKATTGAPRNAGPANAGKGGE